VTLHRNASRYREWSPPTDIESIHRLAREIRRRHYPDIITSAQIEYMLQQQYAPALIATELNAGRIVVVDECLLGHKALWIQGGIVNVPATERVCAAAVPW
jgi:hypothetical protein